DAGRLLEDAAECLQAGAAGQGQVQQDQVGTVDGGQVDCLVGGAGFGHDVDVGEGLQQAAQASADQSVVVNDQDSHGWPIRSRIPRITLADRGGGGKARREYPCVCALAGAAVAGDPAPSAGARRRSGGGACGTGGGSWLLPGPAGRPGSAATAPGRWHPRPWPPRWRAVPDRPAATPRVAAAAGLALPGRAPWSPAPGAGASPGPTSVGCASAGRPSIAGSGGPAAPASGRAWHPCAGPA